MCEIKAILIRLATLLREPVLGVCDLEMCLVNTVAKLAIEIDSRLCEKFRVFFA
jgi:hypothetical protein